MLTNFDFVTDVSQEISVASPCVEILVTLAIVDRGYRNEFVINVDLGFGARHAT